MLQKHKNEFLISIQKSGLDPSQFAAISYKPSKSLWLLDRLFPSVPESPIFSVSVKDSRLRFEVRHAVHNFYLLTYRYTLFGPLNTVKDWSTKGESINEVIETFEYWLREYAKKLIEDRQLPDLWAELKLYENVLASNGNNSNDATNFNEAEKADLRRSVERFRLLVEEQFEPSAEQSDFIKERLEYLSNAVDRLNRFDWKGLALSTLLGISVNLTLDVERGRVLFQLFQQAFHATVKLLQ